MKYFDLPRVRKRAFCALLLLGSFSGIRPIHTETGQTIPFELERLKVILPVRVNGSRPLRIILDSGMPGEGVVLFKKELGKELNLEGSNLYQIRGAGRGKESTAVRVESQDLAIADINFTNQPITILQNDVMSGFPTDGVIGNTLFGHHAVHFDFENNIIMLLEPGSFQSGPGWEALTISFNEHGIPFIDIVVSIDGEKDIPLHVYIDSASREALELLVRPEQKFTLPEDLETKYLGRGLSGDITGQFGRVARLKLGPFLLTDVPTAFPNASVRSRQPGADGIICNNTLLRFHVVFDFSGGKLFLKPNSLFRKPFR